MNKAVKYEDQYIKIIEKPAGILSVPLQGKDEDTVSDIFDGIPCHRLDRDTSGLIILAKNETFKEAIQKIFKDRKIIKKYYTLVWGKVEPEKGEIDIPLGRDPKNRLKVVPQIGGRESRTVYRVVRYYPNQKMSLCEVDLKTGRMNQVRAHFTAIGHPVVGDMKYSNKDSDLKRHFLHSYYLSFKHPYTGENIEVKSDLPEDLSNFLTDLS